MFVLGLFQYSGGNLYQALQKLAGGRRAARAYPQLFQHLVGFPIIAAVKQVDGVKVARRVVPGAVAEGLRFLRQSRDVAALRVAAGVYAFAGDVFMGGEREGAVSFWLGHGVTAFVLKHNNEYLPAD